MQHDKQIKDKDDQVVIKISRGYIQDFVEANYGRMLTRPELKEFGRLIWENGDEDLLNWISAAVDQIIKTDKKRKLL